MGFLAFETPKPKPKAVETPPDRGDEEVAAAAERRRRRSASGRSSTILTGGRGVTGPAGRPGGAKRLLGE